MKGAYRRLSVIVEVLAHNQHGVSHKDEPRGAERVFLWCRAVSYPQDGVV